MGHKHSKPADKPYKDPVTGFCMEFGHRVASSYGGSSCSDPAEHRVTSNVVRKVDSVVAIVTFSLTSPPPNFDFPTANLFNNGVALPPGAALSFNGEFPPAGIFFDITNATDISVSLNYNDSTPSLTTNVVSLPSNQTVHLILSSGPDNTIILENAPPGSLKNHPKVRVNAPPDEPPINRTTFTVRADPRTERNTNVFSDIGSNANSFMYSTADNQRLTPPASLASITTVNGRVTDNNAEHQYGNMAFPDSEGPGTYNRAVLDSQARFISQSQTAQNRILVDGDTTTISDYFVAVRPADGDRTIFLNDPTLSPGQIIYVSNLDLDDSVIVFGDFELGFDFDVIGPALTHQYISLQDFSQPGAPIKWVLILLETIPSPESESEKILKANGFVSSRDRLSGRNQRVQGVVKGANENKPSAKTSVVEGKKKPISIEQINKKLNKN